MDVKKSTVYIMKIEKDTYKKDKNLFENRYNMKRKKYSESKKERKVVDSVNINKLIIRK